MTHIYKVRRNEIHENNPIYSSRPLRMYRNELVQCETQAVAVEKHNQQTQLECNTLVRDAKQRSRSNVRQVNNAFQNSRQYLQHGNKLCDPDICKNTGTEKWSNPTFSQNGGTSSSAQIARVVYNNSTIFKRHH